MNRQHGRRIPQAIFDGVCVAVQHRLLPPPPRQRSRDYQSACDLSPIHPASLTSLSLQLTSLCVCGGVQPASARPRMGSTIVRRVRGPPWEGPISAKARFAQTLVSGPAALVVSSRASPPPRPRADGLSHPSETSRTNLTSPFKNQSYLSLQEPILPLPSLCFPVFQPNPSRNSP